MKRRKPLHEQLREAIRRDPRSYYRLSKDCGLPIIHITRFVAGERDITMGTADKLAKALGLELRPIAKE